MARGTKTGSSSAHVDAGVALGETLPGDSSLLPLHSETPSRSAGASWLGRLPSDLGDLHPGAALERFVVLGELGAGGMGVVLAAYDPELDRKVAIKVLRADRGNAGSGSSASASARLLREAQALARLSHPNVVTIYEVASKRDRVALVMEYIDGPTLTEWLVREKRSWHEVLSVFAQAGRGLAAAHSAGLVHRDFKPDNVLVGNHGRARVTDFGLVSTAGSSESSRSDSEITLSSSAASLDGPSNLTCAGSLVGTLAYMAPEQLDGRVANDRADQFSFCVALYEGLYKERPFAGSTQPELREAVFAGRVKEPPSHSEVPRWVRELLLRGLRVAPAARHASMSSLLDALARDPAQRRKRLALGAVVVGLAAVAVFGLTRANGSSKHAVCAAAQDKLAGVWDQDLRAKIRRSFAATNRPHATETTALLERELDRRGRAWIDARVEVCQATHVRGEQSEHLLDLRMRCLDRRLSELRALTELFAGAPDSKLVDKSMTALSATTPLSACDDAEILLEAMPLPEDPRQRAHVAAMRTRLDAIEALRRAGRYKEGIELATEAVGDSQAIDYPAVQAEALQLRALLLARSGDPKDAEKAVHTWLQAAARAREHGMVAIAWSELILLIGSREGQPDRGLALRAAAEAAVAQAGNRDLHLAKLSTVLGLVLAHKGDYATARGHHERVLEIRERTLGPDHPDLAMALGNLAITYAEQGRYAEARRRYQRALKIQERDLGARHPQLGFTLNNLGNVVGYQGDNIAAVAFFERALEIWQRALAPNHPLVATCLNNLGSAHSELGQLDQAGIHYRRALEMFAAKFGSDHPAVATIKGNLGELAVDGKNYLEGIKLCRESLAIFEKTVGSKHPDTAYAHTCIGRAQLGTGDARAALTPLRLALSMREADPGDPVDLADTRFALARALQASGASRSRYIELAQQSRDAYTAAGAHKERDRQEVSQSLQRWAGR